MGTPTLFAGRCRLLSAGVFALLLMPVGASNVALAADAAADLPFATCPAGSELILPTSASRLADGWITLAYDKIGASQEIPPAGFDLLSAPSSVLERHGMQPRPSDAAEARAWERRVAALHPIRTRGLCHDSNRRMATVTKAYSTNWSGEEAVAAKPPTNPKTYNGVTAGFTQPAVSSCATDSALGSWIGLGGDWNAAGLIQAGTAWMGGQYLAFIEQIGGTTDTGGPTYGDLKIAAGHSIWLYITYSLDPTNPYQAFAHYEIDDLTSGWYWSVNVRAEGSYDGRVAEFIDERPSILQNGHAYLTPLAKFTKNTWGSSNLQVRLTSTGAWQNLYNANRYNLTMTKTASITSTALSVPSGVVSGNTFYDTWKNCGTKLLVD